VTVTVREQSSAPPPPVRRGAAARARHHTRRAVVRSAPELRTLVKFGVVGSSGFIVNLIVFSIAHSAGAHYLIATTFAFVAAVVNNFHWNRRWTFKAVGAEAIHHQVRRFLIVSLAAFFLQAGILKLLVDADVPVLAAQTVSVLAAMPFGFIGNRVWTFHEDGGLRRRWARRRERLRAARSEV
jgi:dolichol-phosphate mannosyltransferase